MTKRYNRGAIIVTHKKVSFREILRFRKVSRCACVGVEFALDMIKEI